MEYGRKIWYGIEDFWYGMEKKKIADGRWKNCLPFHTMPCTYHNLTSRLDEHYI